MPDKPDETSTWDDVRRVADELRLKLHLAGMEAREQWENLQPKIAELQRTVETGAHEAGSAVSEQVSSLGTTLRKLLADIGVGGDKDAPKPS